MRRDVRRAGVFFSFLLFLVPTLEVLAQTPSSLTPDQLQVFQNLPPDQQKAIIDSMSSKASSAMGGTADDAGRSAAGESTGLRQQAPNAGARNSSTKVMVPEGPPRIGSQSTILITVDLTPKPVPMPGQPALVDSPEALKALLQDRRDRIRDGNPYRLNELGQVSLPALPPITLSGLTAVEATQLLNADPRLAGLLLKVSLLPVAPIGTEALKPFGYELFTTDHSGFGAPASSGVPGTSLNPATNIPVPAGYVVGPGDTFQLEFYGKKVGRYSLVVDRDGRLHLPDLGPMEVAGLSFDGVKSDIERRIGREMIGVQVSVSMGQLRSIQVFVTGDVMAPGSYTVNGLSTITNALFACGGISPIGSFRAIELKRRGVVVSRLDLYALLLNGDSSGDARLEAGDVVFVRPVGATAGVTGEVRRPAIYELREGNTVGELISLSGGLAPEADPHAAKVERIENGQRRVVLDVDVSESSALAMRVRAGDVLSIPRVLDELASTVTLQGEVQRPGRYSWHEQMHLTELLSGLNALKEDSDQRYVLIRRERFPDRRVSVISADAVAAFAAPGSAADPLLQSRDRVIVFPLHSDRGVALEDVLKDVRAQARDEAAPPIVSVGGRVRAPGDYPLEPGMTVGDLIRAGGGLDEAAYSLDAELTRLTVATDASSRRTEVVPIRLPSVLAKDSAANLELRPYDTLVIKEVPEWAAQGTVTLRGEVRFPGRYPIAKGETLSSVIKRAGGLTAYAFPEGSVFSREEIKEQEREQIDTLAKRMQADLTTLALQSTQEAGGKDAGQALTVGQNLLTQLRNAEPVGRLVIDVRHAISSPGSEDDVQLRSGDTLAIPRLRQYVTVLGEVENPTSHIWKRGYDRDNYIDLSGGTTPRADKARIYVVRADGSVVAHGSSSWFARTTTSIHTGDTIVVPLDAERMRPLAKWAAITQILYNIAIATAAVHAL